jgi:hypothetical protein
MLVKIHPSYRIIVAIADSDLLGKSFEEDKREIKITENFFKGDEKNSKEVEELIKEYSYEDATFNIVGKESISIALKTGIIKPEGIQKIKGIPVALVLL